MTLLQWFLPRKKEFRLERYSKRFPHTEMDPALFFFFFGGYQRHMSTRCERPVEWIKQFGYQNPVLDHVFQTSRTPLGEVSEREHPLPSEVLLTDFSVLPPISCKLHRCLNLSLHCKFIIYITTSSSRVWKREGMLKNGSVRLKSPWLPRYESWPNMLSVITKIRHGRNGSPVMPVK